MIRFGTSGWRAVLGEGFTFDKARRVVTSIVRVARESGDPARGIVLASDTRFLGERFVEEAARVIAREGVRPIVADRDVPTPAVSFAIRSLGALGGINFTASDNPPEYNGIKFSTADGAPALPRVTSMVEAAIAKTTAADAAPAPKAAFDRLEASASYLRDLAGKVDTRVLAASGLRVAVDPRFGTSRGYLDLFLRGAGIDVTTINFHRDPYSVGLSARCDEANLGSLAAVVTREKRALGLATDGDGNRFGVLDADGSYVDPNLCLMLLTDMLLARRSPGDTRGVARSVATTHGLDAVAKAHGAPLFSRPVGFRYIGELLLAGKIVVGGEESAGFTMEGHVPVKDGLLAGLLLAELVARTGKSLRTLLDDLFERVGRFVPARTGVRLDPSLAAKLKKRLDEDPSTFAGLKVEGIDRTDGQKLLLGSGRWILLRPSGTEAVIRIHAESDSETETARLVAAAKAHVFES